MNKFFVVEYDGTENGPFPTHAKAKAWADNHQLASFNSYESAEKFINDYDLSHDDKLEMVVIVEKE